MSAIHEAIKRLERSTWDNRTAPSREDVRTMFAALHEALADYSAPMSCLTSAERGECLADAIRELLPERGAA